MKKTYSPLLSIIFLLGILAWLYLTMMPPWVSDDAVSLSEFSTKRAMEHVVAISKEPHYTGSANHGSVSTLLESELRKMGLETQIQEGTTLSDWGNLVKSRNILARIKGTSNTKALLL
ncbi:MAG TPA: peptidase M28, partial [Flavobacterium sp.]